MPRVTEPVVQYEGLPFAFQAVRPLHKGLRSPGLVPPSLTSALPVHRATGTSSQGGKLTPGQVSLMTPSARHAQSVRQ